MKDIRITLIRGLAGRTKRQRGTVKALGLGRISSSVVLKPTPVNLGMINSISHLLRVEEVD